MNLEESDKAAGVEICSWVSTYYYAMPYFFFKTFSLSPFLLKKTWVLLLRTFYARQRHDLVESKQASN